MNEVQYKDLSVRYNEIKQQFNIIDNELYEFLYNEIKPKIDNIKTIEDYKNVYNWLDMYCPKNSSIRTILVNIALDKKDKIICSKII